MEQQHVSLHKANKQKNLVIGILSVALVVTLAILVVVLQNQQTSNTQASSGFEAANIDTSGNPPPPEGFMINALKNAK